MIKFSFSCRLCTNSFVHYHFLSSTEWSNLINAFLLLANLCLEYMHKFTNFWFVFRGCLILFLRFFLVAPLLPSQFCFHPDPTWLNLFLTVTPIQLCLKYFLLDSCLFDCCFNNQTLCFLSPPINQTLLPHSPRCAFQPKTVDIHTTENEEERPKQKKQKQQLRMFIYHYSEFSIHFEYCFNCKLKMDDRIANNRATSSFENG